MEDNTDKQKETSPPTSQETTSTVITPAEKDADNTIFNNEDKSDESLGM